MGGKDPAGLLAGGSFVQTDKALLSLSHLRQNQVLGSGLSCPPGKDPAGLLAETWRKIIEVH